MRPRYGAICGIGLDGRAVELGLAAFGARSDVEMLEEHDARAEVSGWLTAESGRVVLEVLLKDSPADVGRVLDFAHTIATSAKIALRVAFSGFDGESTPDYCTFEIDASGARRSIQVEEADRFLREHPQLDPDAKEELWQLLYEQLGDDGPDLVVAQRSIHFGFRMRALVADPRLAELITAAQTAKSVELTKQPDGRTLARLVLSNGARRLAFLTAEEAETFARLRSSPSR